ncbi:BON domain-containing protein [Halioxenophilus aromaticivorans]|uniref:BON domain-containing protein n=1 Tax=Halioxenophilus aromaticivorans TaxID=1306992 RepID=A0AAV3U2U5_9ALTE
MKLLHKKSLAAAVASVTLVTAPLTFAGMDKDSVANKTESAVEQTKDATQDATQKVGQTIEQRTDEGEAYFKNGWQEGKIETAFLFNEHLNNFKLDSEVIDGNAVLTGEVDSSVKKDLANEIALSIEGIESVDNRIEVVNDEQKDGERNEFLASVQDATITAVIKMKYLVNDDLSAIDIKVDTKDQIVILSGEVETDVQKQLAEAIATNSDDVVEVQNQIKVLQS